MADIDKFTTIWTGYLHDLGKAGSHTAIEALFLDFVQKAFGIPLNKYKLEERVYGGRIDALLGNLVFEFKRDLVKERIDAETGLHHYISQLKEKNPSSTYTGIATDGVKFRVYAANLEVIAERDLRRARPEDVLFFLDSVLFIFRSLETPTTSNIVSAFGPDSPTFLASHSALSILFRGVKEEAAVKVRFGEWQKYLERVYGEAVGNEALFIKHTYLATLAKFIAFFFRSGSNLPTEQDAEDIVTGAKFSRQGINNFIEDDFFSWPLNSKARREGLPLIMKLVASLLVYDFSAAKQDILKELYEEILGQEARHNLGEYYTPDWLAEYVLSQMVQLQENPQWRLLDPACGSGTFLFIAVRLLRDTLENLGTPRLEVLRRIQSQVVGMDVHPVAVTIARTNYLLALGDLLQPLPEPISIPVYLADTLRPPPVQQIFYNNSGEEAFFQVEAENNKVFSIPSSIGSGLDSVVARMRDFLTHPPEQALAGFQKEMEKLSLNPAAREAVVKDMEILLSLFKEGKDTVWLFILKNMPRPRFLQGSFDLVVGNPPWLSFRHMESARYVTDVKRLSLKTFRLLGSGKTHLYTQLDLAPLFFVQASFLYLRKGGHIAFVMPRGVLSADQYADFTSFDFQGDESISFERITFSLEHVVDLAPVPKDREVTPLFRQTACVLLAQKDGKTSFPVASTEMEGKLPAKNLSWAEASKLLKFTPNKLSRVAGRLLSGKSGQKTQAKSSYYDRVLDGATLYPRNFFFVRAAKEPGPATRPVLETDEEEARQTKDRWKDIRMRGAVEAQFIFATLLGGDVFPFAHAPPRPVVLPLLLENGKPVLINYPRAVEMGYTGLATWLKGADTIWQLLAKKSEAGTVKISNILEQINYRNKITNQRVTAGYKTLYNAAGTHLVSCVLDLSSLPPVALGREISLKARAFIADTKTFYVETANLDEANYLAATLNSAVIDERIKGSQSRGLFGERDIHKKPFLLPIPLFDPSRPSHMRLAELAKECQGKVDRVLPGLLSKYRGSGPLRTHLRQVLKEELKTIDWHVRRIL
ncbi:MAG: N-6 DNA methylase [Chloroflexi bacterium]|nr:N-6 DNA methylase [Chloroflexota bacterium]